MNENKKEHHLHIVLTTQQYQLLCCQAKECRLTKRAYLARLIEGRPVKARPTKEIKELRTEIHHIGNNINQIARRLNEGRVRGERAVLTGSEKAEIRALAGLVFTIADQVQEMSRNRRAALKLEVDKALAPLIREARDGPC